MTKRFCGAANFGGSRPFRRLWTLPLFDMLQQGIESRIHVGTQIAKARIIDEDSHEYGDCGNTDGKSDLNSLIGHRCFQNTPSQAQGATSC